MSHPRVDISVREDLRIQLTVFDEKNCVRAAFCCPEDTAEHVCLELFQAIARVRARKQLAATKRTGRLLSLVKKDDAG